MKSIRKIFYVLLVIFILFLFNKTNNTYASTTEVTVLEISEYLSKQKEHYPLSDEMIERYQQNSGGYITYADTTNKDKNRLRNEPNQKWHYLTSWLMQSIDENPKILGQKAQTRVYSGLLCPELLLWIYEACGVDQTKLRECVKAIETGKINGTTSSIASAMKQNVSYNDMIDKVVEYLENNTDSHTISENSDGNYISGIDGNFKRGELITFTLKNIPSSKDANITCGNAYPFKNDNGSYSFYMPYENVTLNVTLIDNGTIDDGVSTVTLGEHNNSSVKVDDNDFSNATVDDGSTFTFKVTPNENYSINKVLVNNTEINGNNGIYSFAVTSDSTIIVKCRSTLSNDFSSKYNISCDGTSVHLISDTEKNLLINSLVVNTDDENVIDSIGEYSYIYTGGSGGKGDTAWKVGNLLKFGTTSVRGSCIFNLSSNVNKVIITGYSTNTALKINVGDSNDSTKQVEKKCSDMTVASKNTIENNEANSIEITFSETDSVKISTVNSYVLYISSIEFIYDSSLE